MHIGIRIDAVPKGHVEQLGMPLARMCELMLLVILAQQQVRHQFFENLEEKLDRILENEGLATGEIFLHSKAQHPALVLWENVERRLER